MNGARVRAATAALFLFLSIPSFAEDAGEVFLLKVVRRYQAAKSFSADFRQEVPLQNLGIVRKASGRVYFERPLKMRWDYRGKDQQLYLSDGEYFYFRPAESPQIFRRRIDEKALGGKIPLLLLFGKGNISDMFRVEELIRREGKGETVLRLVPRGEGAPEVRRIDLVVKNDGLEVREIHVYDRMGGANHLYFGGEALDPSLPPGHFRFRKPEGLGVVDG